MCVCERERERESGVAKAASQYDEEITGCIVDDRLLLLLILLFLKFWHKNIKIGFTFTPHDFA